MAQETNKKKTSSSSCLFLALSAWWVCVNAHFQDLKQETNKKKASVSEMIVAASCGTKNNNASLQSNN